MVANSDVRSVDGWIGYIAAHPSHVGLVVDDGTARVVAHREKAQQPLASAIKVVHLAAYSRAVAEGNLDPHEPVPVTEWERWHLPGTDGGAHDRALRRLGGKHSVTLDQMVSAMIRESDNATPEYLRERLGDQALIDAASAGGWHGFQSCTFLGQQIRLLVPSVSEDAPQIARRYANDERFRNEIRSVPTPERDVQTAWAESTPAGSANQLTALHRALSTGTFGNGADIAQRHLEWQVPPEGFAGFGLKGGSLPGILTEAMTLRRRDGAVSSAVLLTRRMTKKAWSAGVESYAHQRLLFALMVDPDFAPRFVSVLSRRGAAR